MAEKTVKLTYHGPNVLVVELERTLEDGDTIDVPEALASRLLCASGFDGPDKLKPPQYLEGQAPEGVEQTPSLEPAPPAPVGAIEDAQDEEK